MRYSSTPVLMLVLSCWLLPAYAALHAPRCTTSISMSMSACNSGSRHARLVVSTHNKPLPDHTALDELSKVDASFASRVVTAASEEHARIVMSPTGSLTGDVDDVRKVGEAAGKAAAAALSMGAVDLTLELDESIESVEHPADGPGMYKYAALVAGLGVLQRVYVPLQAREGGASSMAASVRLALQPSGRQLAADALDAIEAGRMLARDIGSGDPEVMTPLRLASAVQEAVQDVAGVEVSIVNDLEALGNEYPLLMAVARASVAVERHRPCVVRMEWRGRGEITRTVCVAGKGVTYDVGGADIKVGGSMAGMRRDKCGAAAAAGFFLACARADPALTEGLQLIVELGCVRNSVGADAFVADEIITGHAGQRVLIGNTDAEGRLVLADVLSNLRARVVADPSAHPQPTLLSLATLTGHASRSFGPYAAATDSAAARAAGGVASRLASAGALLGQPLEVSSLRREDFRFIAPGCGNTPVAQCGALYDVLQSNNAPTAVTARGHQFPMAFLLIASGLMEHGAADELPLPFCHVDLADSVADEYGVETGSPILPLFGHFVLGLG